MAKRLELFRHAEILLEIFQVDYMEQETTKESLFLSSSLLNRTCRYAFSTDHRCPGLHCPRRTALISFRSAGNVVTKPLIFLGTSLISIPRLFSFWAKSWVLIPLL